MSKTIDLLTPRKGSPIFGIVTIEPMRCCLCGKGIEAGQMVGGRISDMVHPDCLTIDPFAETHEADQARVMTMRTIEVTA